MNPATAKPMASLKKIKDLYTDMQKSPLQDFGVAPINRRLFTQNIFNIVKNPSKLELANACTECTFLFAGDSVQ